MIKDIFRATPGMSIVVAFFAVFAWSMVQSDLFSQERIDLTAPETTPNNTAYRLDRITFIFNNPSTPADEGFIHIQLQGIDRPELLVSCSYTPTTSPTATSLNTPFQKANLSSAYNNNATTGSLKQRIHHRLIVMGESATVCARPLVGTLSGNPE